MGGRGGGLCLGTGDWVLGVRNSEFGVRNWSVDSGQLTVVSGTGRQREPARAVASSDECGSRVVLGPSCERRDPPCPPLRRGGARARSRMAGVRASSGRGTQVSSPLRMRYCSVDSGQLTVVRGAGRQRVPARAVGRRTSAAHALYAGQVASNATPPFYAKLCYRLRPLSSLIGRRTQLLPPREGGERSARSAREREISKASEVA